MRALDRKVGGASKSATRRAPPPTPSMLCRAKFLRFFPGGFEDPKYQSWERDYKSNAHQQWMEQLGRKTFQELLQARDYSEIATRAVRIESRTNLLFSFEKMALRDAVRSNAGAETFSKGLFRFLYAVAPADEAFTRWCDAVASLPRIQTRVLTWPVVTIFGFLAQPERHIFFKPNVTRIAAASYDVDIPYRSRPNWETYSSLLAFGKRVLQDQRDLGALDMIDAQSFIWVQGSSEYEE